MVVAAVDLYYHINSINNNSKDKGETEVVVGIVATTEVAIAEDLEETVDGNEEAMTEIVVEDMTDEMIKVHPAEEEEVMDDDNDTIQLRRLIEVFF